jgi:hypothetical protein
VTVESGKEVTKDFSKYMDRRRGAFFSVWEKR